MPQIKYLEAFLLSMMVFSFISCRQAIGPAVQPEATQNIEIPILVTPEAEVLIGSPTLSPTLSNSSDLNELVSVQVVSASEEPVGLQMPAFVEAEIAGRSIKSVDLIAGKQEENGDRRLFLFDELKLSKIPGDSMTWADGVYEVTHVWPTDGDYLTDGASGDFVILRESGDDEMEHLVGGQFRSAGQEEYIDARLIIDIESGQSTGVKDSASGEGIIVQAGDEFRISDILLLDDFGLTISPGISLIFDEVGQIRYEKRPLPGGEYFFGLLSETNSGFNSADFRNLTIGNENLRPGIHTHFDPKDHFQFFYPEYFSGLKEGEGGLTSRNISDTLRLKISNFDDTYQMPLSNLKSDVLRTFGDVQILYEDTAPVGTTGALRTAYGYDARDGSHTGVFLAFYQGETAYIVDVDGLSDEESRVLETVEILSESWVTRPGASGSEAGTWRLESVNDFDFVIPSGFQAVRLNNGWIRLSGEEEETFFALRTEPAAGGRILDRMRHWLEVAARDVNDFAYSDFYTLELSNRSWVRLEFTYEIDGGNRIAGSIMAARFDDDLIFSWAEAPENIFHQFEQEKLLLILAGPGRSGV